MRNATYLDLMRHGVCAGGHIFRGNNDVALTELGHTQMQQVVGQCADWSLIVTSPLQRCAQFARALAQQRAIDCMVDERLRELDFGDWEGQEIAAVWRNDSARMQAWSRDPSRNAPPSGETLAGLAQRVQACIDDLLQAYCGQRLLLVTHGGVMRVALGQALDIPLSCVNRLDVPYACLSTLAVFDDDAGRVTRLLGHNRLGPVGNDY